MAIFNKPDKQQQQGATIIAKGTKIVGEIIVDCNLHIDGVFEGSIDSKSVVTIGKSGIITGDIIASKVIISGNFTGVVESDTVEILPDGKIFGKVISSEFMIENKGIFEGESKIKNVQKNVIKGVKEVNNQKIEFKDLKVENDKQLEKVDKKSNDSK
jgi:cytoskeletal protein CcmA (bactofilin family)